MSLSSVAFGVGSNSGPSRKLLSFAVESMSTWLVEPRVASVYRTEAVSNLLQPHYLNTAIVGRTDLSPESLLAIAKRMEQLAGRTIGARNGPRTLDIDLLLYAQRISKNPELTLPHPRLRNRAFVLVPLSEIAPDWEIPPQGQRVIEALADLSDLSGVERLTPERI